MSDKVKDSHGRLLRSAGLVSGFTLLSRLLGLGREQVFAALLGAGLHADAFQIAYRIPNLLRDLFAEGALSAAFVPTYARTLKERGRQEALRLGSRLLTLLGLVLAAVVVVGLVFADPLVGMLAPGFQTVAGKADLTVLLTRVMLPFLPLVSFAAVAMGMLNAEERYGAPALAPALFNLVAILWAGLLWALGLPPQQVALGWAVGTLLGGAAQFLVQVPALRRQGWRFQAEWAPADPGIRRVMSLMAPATVGLAAVQVNVFVNSIFASHEQGAVSWLNYAFRILYLPIGVFGVSVGTIATSGMARCAATGDLDGLRDTLRRSLRTMAFLTIPSTVGLLAVGVPVVRLLYQRGKFGVADTEATATALAYYALGMVAYTGVKVLAPAFYALNAPRVPLLASVSAVATNLIVNLSLYGWLGFRSVALGTSLGALVNIGVLLVAFERRLGGLRRRGLASALAAMTGLSAAMGLIAAATAWALTGWLGTRGLPAHLATGLLPVAVGAIVYGGGAYLAGLPEARELWALACRRGKAQAQADA